IFHPKEYPNWVVTVTSHNNFHLPRLWPLTMVSQAASNIKKTRIAREVKDGLYLQAVALYKSEHSHSHNVNPKSYQKCCNQITEDHCRKTEKVIKLSHATLRRHVKGGISLSVSNVSQGWLLQPEVEIVINYSIEMASRNFPLNHEQLK
ncbi:hypothetical protein C8J56DRAFT_741328, partial [Mycena floridula]